MLNSLYQGTMTVYIDIKAPIRNHAATGKVMAASPIRNSSILTIYQYPNIIFFGL